MFEHSKSMSIRFFSAYIFCELIVFDLVCCSHFKTCWRLSYFEYELINVWTFLWMICTKISSVWKLMDRFTRNRKGGEGAPLAFGKEDVISLLSPLPASSPWAPSSPLLSPPLPSFPLLSPPLPSSPLLSPPLPSSPLPSPLIPGRTHPGSFV